VRVPKNTVKFLIGFKGTNLRKLINQADGGMIKFVQDVGNEHEEEAKIMGNERQVTELKKLLLEEVERAKVEAAKPPAERPARTERPPQQQQREFRSPRSEGGGDYVEEVIVDSYYVGALIGKGGSALKEMVQQSGAWINYSDRENGSSERTARIRGTPDQVKAAKQLITEKVHAIAQEAQQQGGNRLPQRRMMGGGGRDRDRRSLDQDQPRRNAREPSPNDVKQVVEVPSETVGYLIGSKGNVLFSIQNETSTRIDFAKQDHREGAREVTIVGSDEGVQRACEIIQTRVKESLNNKNKGGL